MARSCWTTPLIWLLLVFFCTIATVPAEMTLSLSSVDKSAGGALPRTLAIDRGCRFCFSPFLYLFSRFFLRF
jgi:hypothetical protein